MHEYCRVDFVAYDCVLVLWHNHIAIYVAWYHLDLLSKISNELDTAYCGVVLVALSFAMLNS